MSWRSTTLSTTPPSLEVATTDIVALEYDATPALAGSEHVTAVNTRLLRLDTLAAITIDPPTETGDVITQVIDGSDLVRGVDFELAWVATVSASKVLTGTTVLVVVA